MRERSRRWCVSMARLVLEFVDLRLPATLVPKQDQQEAAEAHGTDCANQGGSTECWSVHVEYPLTRVRGVSAAEHDGERHEVGRRDE